MIGEEFPARLRGRAIAILTSLATVGVMLMAKVQPYVLVPEGAEGNLLHDLGHGMVSITQGAFGLEVDGASWRALYALGLVPLVLVLFLRIAMRETRRFDAERARKVDAPKRSWRDLAREAALPWRPEYRRRSAIVALLWNSRLHRHGPVDRVLGDLRARGARSHHAPGRRHRVLGLRRRRRGSLRRGLADRPDRPQAHLRGLLRAGRDRDLPALPRADGAAGSTCG